MNLLKKYLKSFLQIPLFKNILVLVTGTGIAQFFPILSAPFVARLYTPEDFGIYAIFYSLVTILSGIVFLDYINAIILEKNKKDVYTSFALSFLLLFAFSLLLVLIIFFIPYNTYEKLLGGNLKKFIWYLPLTVFFNGLSTLLYTWYLRFGMFKLLTKNKLVLAISSVMLQISIGILNLGALGFILANLLSLSLSVVLFLYSFNNLKYLILKAFKWSEIVVVIKKHKKFPLVTVWSNSLNIYTSQIPQFLLNVFFGSTVLGYYSMATRLVGLPLGFVSSSVQDVFKQSASAEFLADRNCVKVYKKTFFLLFGLAIVVGICIFTIFPFFFKLFLGDKWVVSSEYAQVMCLLLLIRFIAAPLSYVFYVSSKQLIDLIWQIAFCIISYFSLYFGYHNFNYKSPLSLLFFYSLICSIIYIINIMLSYKYAKNVS